jgi:hypothetical protein
MRKIILLAMCLATTFMLNAISVSVITTPGNLSGLIRAKVEDFTLVTDLTVAGSIGWHDFICIREYLPNLSSLNLSEVTVENDLIPATAFQYHSALTSIALPSSVTKIGDYAFFNCSGLTSITLPSSLDSIGSNAFFWCSKLESVTIPSSVNYIGSYAFCNCPNLRSLTIPSSITSIEPWVFAGCSGLTSITIPSLVTSIGESAFYGCSGLTSVAIPSSVASIGVGAFLGCSSITSIIIPTSVTSIGESAFVFCSGFITLEEGNPNYSSIDGVLFNKTFTKLMHCSTSKIGSYLIPPTVTSVEESAFANCTGLTSVIVPISVTSISGELFYGCSGLTSVTIPSTVTSIGYGAFRNCSGLTSITIPLQVKDIRSETFWGCSSLKSISIPSFVHSIGYRAFFGCLGLTTITIPSSVTSIDIEAFRNCTGLTSIEIPSSVTSIGKKALSNCRALTSIYAFSRTPVILEWESEVFENVNTNSCILYVPANTNFLYQNAVQWRDFLNIVAMPIGTGIEQQSADNAGIYPNPATNGFYIRGLEASSLVRVLDLNGKTVLTQNVTTNTYVSIDALPSGLYVVKINTSTGTLVRKLIKQ